MSKNFIQFVVIILGVFIIIAFLAIIYGMYLKISKSSNNLINTPYIFSTKLNNNEKILNIEVIDKNKLLILIESADNIKGAIYDIENNKIIRFIER
ncbi:MAG: hypothetical protein MKZ97_04160 [Alphaproteobacteria bacterium]|jgi:hypothetical protein|nr:hypothetical protein [Alphaproteobacteria bacterium]|tara:strand:- start:4376 stop:4663 length:288 start_codon:yes stop_codon:yes gene_type:complete